MGARGRVRFSGTLCREESVCGSSDAKPRLALASAPGVAYIKSTAEAQLSHDALFWGLEVKHKQCIFYLNQLWTFYNPQYGINAVFKLAQRRGSAIEQVVIKLLTC